MIYLDLIISTPDPEITITPQQDHNYTALRYQMSKPTISLWELYKLKRFIDDSHKKLTE